MCIWYNETTVIPKYYLEQFVLGERAVTISRGLWCIAPTYNELG